MIAFQGCDQRSDLEKSLHGSSLYDYQWHLKNTGQSAGAQDIYGNDVNGTPGEDINLSDVWNKYQGEGIAIAIVDTGIEAKHYDLAENLNLSLSALYGGGEKVSSDPSLTPDQLYGYDPRTEENGPIDDLNAHGTMCAGIAAAVGENGIGVVGVAPKATLVGLNAFADYTDLQTKSFGDALYNPGRAVDVSSNSWNDGPGKIGDDSAEFAAIRNGATLGRNGRGIVYCFAAGNERYYAHNANWNRELNTPYVITVAALDADGIYASYSNKGANILISGFGGEDGVAYPAIVTTDLMGELGLDREEHFDVPGNREGDFTNLMNGTSAAAPMIAGVAALLLDVNESLSYRDVRYILAVTARKNDPGDYTHDWVQNGAGHWVNHSYGFGAVDVAGAVAMAETFPGLDANITQVIASGDLNQSFPATVTFQSDLNVTNDMVVEYVELELELAHDYPEDFKIVLTSPDETNSTLSSPTAYAILYPDFFNGFTLGSVRHLDEHAKGIWRVSFFDSRDHSTGDGGTLYRYKLILHGRQLP